MKNDMYGDYIEGGREQARLVIDEDAKDQIKERKPTPAPAVEATPQNVEGSYVDPFSVQPKTVNKEEKKEEA